MTTTETSEQPVQAEEAAETGKPQGEQPRTFTQDEMEAILGERLRAERKKHADDLMKFADYDDLKSKAVKFDELEAANKSELDKANDAAAKALKRAEDAEGKIARLEAEAAHAALVAKVASDEDVPANLLQGADEDELRASARALKEYMDAVRPKVPETKAGGASPAPDDREKLSEREEFAFRVR